MKHSVKLISLALCLILGALVLSSCKTTLKPGDNGLYDEKNGVKYINASTMYEATNRDKEYGKLEIAKDLSYTLYTIPGIDPTELLATEDDNILYASTLTMPTLKEMKPNAMHLCIDGSKTTHVLFTITDGAQLQKLVDTYMNGSNVTYTSTQPLRDFRVRFASPDYPGFYYTLTYLEYADDVEVDGVSYGKYFLRSPFENQFIPVDDTIHAYFGDDSDKVADKVAGEAAGEATDTAAPTP